MRTKPIALSSLLVIALAISVSTASAAMIDVATVGRTLDLTSFPNSTGPRREPDKRTPEDYGFTNMAMSGSLVTFAEPDGSWQISLEILGLRPGRILACFRDQAQSGGSYNAQQALDLTLGPDGLYRAQERTGTPRCPARP